MADNFNSLDYKSGCFFIEQPIEPDAFDDDKYLFYSRIGNYLSDSPVSENLETTLECINFWHELNHYVQDLSCFACIVETETYDYIAACIKELSTHPELRFPFFDKGNIEHNNHVDLDENYAYHKKMLEKLTKLYNYLFEKQHKKPNSEDYCFNSLNEGFLDNYSLSFKHLIECYAKHKSYWDAFYMAKDKKECDLLHKLAKEKDIFPYTFENGKLNFDLLKLKQNQEYALVNHIIIVCIALTRPGCSELFDYYENKIPLDVRKTEAEQIFCITKLILEVALNIPSIEYILNVTEEGKYQVEDFCPSLRFYKTVKAVRDNNGFPDAKDGEDFYITFHNWVSERMGWPSYEDTYHSIDTALMERFNHSGENMITEQLNGILIKKEHYKDFLNWPAMWVLQHMHQKLLFCNGQGLEIINLIGYNRIYNTGLTSFYQEWFSEKKTRKRQLLYDTDSNEERMKKIFTNNQASIRESLCRMFSRAATDAYLHTGRFECPLSKMTCPYCTSYCRDFQDFDYMNSSCKMCVLRLPWGLYMRPEGEGNFPDCMFYNYMLDFKYNLSKLI